MRRPPRFLAPPRFIFANTVFILGCFLLFAYSCQREAARSLLRPRNLLPLSPFLLLCDHTTIPAIIFTPLLRCRPHHPASCHPSPTTVVPFWTTTILDTYTFNTVSNRAYLHRTLNNLFLGHPRSGPPSGPVYRVASLVLLLLAFPACCFINFVSVFRLFWEGGRCSAMLDASVTWCRFLDEFHHGLKSRESYPKVV